jgi:hypothetical protein
MGRRAGGAGRQRTIPRPPDLTAAPARTGLLDGCIFIPRGRARQCVAARGVVGDGERAVAVVVGGRQAVGWAGQPPGTAVCHGGRERRLPATRGRRPACRRLLRAADLSCCHRPGDGQFLRGQAGERPGRRQLACRMTGCLLDDLPRAVPRSGMGALIAARGGRGFGGGHEPGLCRFPVQPAGADEARGIRQQIPVLPGSADDDDAVRAGPRPPGTRTGSCPGGAPARPRSASLLTGPAAGEDGTSVCTLEPLDRARA